MCVYVCVHSDILPNKVFLVFFITSLPIKLFFAKKLILIILLFQVNQQCKQLTQTEDGWAITVHKCLTVQTVTC